MKRGVLIMFIASLILISCEDNEPDLEYRESMRDFVKQISSYSKDLHPGFIVIPQNGHELVSTGGEGINDPHAEYLSAIDGAGQEDLYYGYKNDDVATDDEDTEYLMGFLNICEENGVEVLVTDYCYSEEKVNLSYSINHENGFISFAAPDRELGVIPDNVEIFNENSSDINDLSEAMNFLYLINPDRFDSRDDFITSLRQTNYDLIIIDLFFNETELTQSDISELQTKANGGRRLVISYMSIGEAEDYRYYWKEEWNNDKPDWLDEENPDWEGNYKVRYWNADWQNIIFGSSESYLDKIINAGFDGVYLDIIEAFEYFE
ncbi:MAG: endo alpha-1,4 polygalactosaminidase [Bacteroidales bacterium]|nr:endo alpha-1,4 polygalactosaminidase [Bacteroidales bacterium]